MGYLFPIKCNLFLIIVGIEIKYLICILPPSYQIGDKQIFEISSDEVYDESENEMLQPEDLQGIESLVEDEAKYKPLHYHVENYNLKTAKKAVKTSGNIIFYPIMEKNINEESEPFISGFKHDLDRIIYEKPHFLKKKSAEGKIAKILKNKNTGYVNNNNKRIKREEEDFFESTDPDFFQGSTPNSEATSEENDYLSSQFTELPTTEVDKFQEQNNSSQFTESSTKSEDYDYDKLREEYYQQIEDMSKRNELFVYTEKENLEEKLNTEKNKTIVPKVVKIPKNCTNRPFKIGIDFDCFFYDFETMKNVPDFSIAVGKFWKKIRIWLLLYICVTTYFWCKKGWCCCCCCCCQWCYPEEVMKREKKYFAENPPGTLVKRWTENGIIKVETEEFEPTLFEYDAYDQMKQQIRKL